MKAEAATHPDRRPSSCLREAIVIVGGGSFSLRSASWGARMARANRQSALREAFTGMLQNISRRPTLYTRNGSFWEVVAYVDGYVRGSGFPSGEQGMEVGMNPFGRWLALQFGQAENCGWSGALLDHCGGDEEHAVKQMWPLFEEYLRRK